MIKVETASTVHLVDQQPSQQTLKVSLVKLVTTPSILVESMTNQLFSSRTRLLIQLSKITRWLSVSGRTPTQVGNTSSFWIHSPSAGANERGFQAHVPWSNGTIYFDQSGCCNGNQRLTVGGKVIVNEWQHFVFQRNADGNQEIWVNGQKVAENGGTAEALEAFTKITIGAEGNNNNNSLAGRIDEFAVWNRMLTAEEITTLQSSATTEILNITPSDADGDGLTDAEEYALRIN